MKRLFTQNRSKLKRKINENGLNVARNLCENKSSLNQKHFTKERVTYDFFAIKVQLYLTTMCF